MEDSTMFMGIDVGLRWLDLAATTAVPSLPRRVPNTAEGIATLVATLVPLPPTLIVLEATGRYHGPLLAALLAAAVPVSVINPAQSAAFRIRQLGRHKTDRADAKLLARFGELHHAELRRATAQEPDLARLRQLVGYRDDLVQLQTAIRNRQHAAEWAGDPAILDWLADDLAQITARLKQVTDEIAAVLATIPDSAVLTAQAGVGMLTAAAVLAYLPAGVHGNPKAAAAYAGLHPRQEQSGQRERSRLSKQGCPAVRRYLYLAAQCAVRHDPILKAWYEALCARGKARQSALCAVAHKLLRQMMGRLRQARAEQVAAAAPPELALPCAA
ncbi:MAG: IS110 family transposase [Thermomicrobiales bacterium]|nr:IS110 family transposase [Thermomicrobiales bacterium]